LRVGVISDTHGLLRPEAEQALHGVDLIVHAGDVGKPEVLTNLRKIAPVFAVRGNVDTGGWAQELPITNIVETGKGCLYVLHNLRELNLRPETTGFAVVISGHTHQVEQRAKDGILYLNPGSAGPKRFHLPVTLAILDLAKRRREVEIIHLPCT
jgi:uncharacterized protein